MYTENGFNLSNVEYRFGRGAYLRFQLPKDQERKLKEAISGDVNLGSIVESLDSFGKGFRFYTPRLSADSTPVFVAMRRPTDGSRGNTSVVVVPANQQGADIVFVNIATALKLEEVSQAYQAHSQQTD